MDAAVETSESVSETVTEPAGLYAAVRAEAAFPSDASFNLLAISRARLDGHIMDHIWLSMSAGRVEPFRARVWFP